MQRKAPDVPLLANDILYVTDRTGKRIALTTLEKVLGVGTALSGAAIYTLK